MPLTYNFAGRSNPETCSGSDNQRVSVDKDRFQLHIKREPPGNENEILPRENCGLLKCEKCDVQFFGAEALHQHKLRGDSEADVRKHFYCGMCRIDFKDESELKSHVMESSEHVVCRKRSREFHTIEALELHSKQLYKPKGAKPATTHSFLSCNVLFSSISGISQHIESGQCHGKLSTSDFRNLVSGENTLLAKDDLSVDISARATTTHASRAGIIPPPGEAAFAGTPNDIKAEGLVPKHFVSVLDHTFPVKPASSRIENLAEYWNEILGVYICPFLKCGKKFCGPTALQAHLESDTHNKKSFRCPTCFSCFASSSALLQHAESEACKVKTSPAYKQFIEDATGGLMDQNKQTEYKTCWRK